MTPPFQDRAQRIPLRRGTASPGLRTDSHFMKLRPSELPNHADRSRKPVQVMKFGGTSVADPDCYRSVVKIIRKASAANNVVVVVSAMSDVTNKLVEAAARSEAGDSASASAILDELRTRHFVSAGALIPAGPRRDLLVNKLRELFDYCDRLCQGTALLRELSPRTRDAIWSLGERLSAPMLAAALMESGVASEAVEATDVIVTDSRHGSADPLTDLTRERCQLRLRPLLNRDIVPVTTGFIGATAEGVLTILGRGGSDYSATIVGAALDADEVIIWTDVDGVLTADPTHVRGARTIPEMSYREAAEHAHFGARVLHPKTLRALMQCKFPLWVRNTFAPARPGTKITPAGSAKSVGVKAITAISDVSLITIGGPGIAKVHDVLGRTFATTAAIRANVMLTSHSSSQSEVCLIVSSAHAQRTVESLRYEFAQDLAGDLEEHVNVDPNVAIVTLIGQNMRAMPGIIGRTFGALGRKKVNVIASAQGSSDCNISFAVAQNDVKAALTATHREFKLGNAKTSRQARKKS
jgi:bifunctional aspartokinase / homoserine dehydrogenase 1